MSSEKVVLHCPVFIASSTPRMSRSLRNLTIFIHSTPSLFVEVRFSKMAAHSKTVMREFQTLWGKMVLEKLKTHIINMYD